MAKKTARPVMLRVNRTEEALLGSSRPGFQGRIKIGFSADGRVTAVDLYVVQQNGPHNGGGDLRSASKASVGLERHMPDFYKLLNDYPAAAKPSTETFHWTTYKAHGEPVILLTHAFSMTEGEAFGVCQRQFYVSSSYNVEQAVAVFLPVSKGTLVVYANRTSTDQVAGFGGAAKRSLGGKILASQLESLFEDLQKAAP